MDDILEQIEKVLNAGFPYPALVMALTLPDICASLAFDPSGNEKTRVKARYVAWFDKNVASKGMMVLTAEDCFSLRCGVVHQGRMGNKDAQFDRVAFTENGPAMSEWENCTVNDMQYVRLIQLDIRQFIGRMLEAAREWYQANKEDRFVQENVRRLVRYYPEGIEGVAPQGAIF